jgi:hypothetical protein
LTRRTKSLTAICGGISTNMWTCSLDKTPETICTPMVQKGEVLKGGRAKYAHPNNPEFLPVRAAKKPK